MSERLIVDLRRAIEIVTGSRQLEPERRFHKHDEYLSYGLKTPDFHMIMKDFRSRFLELPLQERLSLAARLLGEHIGELGHAGIHIVALSVEELGPNHFRTLSDLLEDFRSWSHVDNFCGHVMQPLLWRHREKT